ncbi:MAG TPA: Ig-like domain-containing protein [Acidimicrobiia bacterium]|nr:Ig-like domain-containing protein [Acidimicrobiia bacterium]
MPVLLRAAVASPGPGVPTGTVTFTTGAEIVGVAAVDRDGWAVATAALPAGHHTITARYDGDDHHAASSTTANHATHLPTNTVLDIAHGPSRFGEPITLSAFVSFFDPAMPGPTGTVTFANATDTLGMATLDPSGRATLTVALPPGAHRLTATYHGDDGHAASTSSEHAHVVERAPTTITLTVEPAAPPTGSDTAAAATGLRM